MLKTNTLIPHERFCELAEKYGLAVPEGWNLDVRAESEAPRAASWCLRTNSGEKIPLFPWRSERRFIELKRIVETKTLEDVVLCRFSCVSDGQSLSLAQILYREFDLLEWITGSKIVSVFGSTNDQCFSNVLTKLESGTVASIEAGTTLPKGTETLDRHELIARRGVASDRVVDTHVPQQSVCLFEGDGMRSWTDTDAELFDMPQDEINAVRAAFESAKTPEIAASNQSQHQHLLRLVDRALHS